MNDTPPPNPQTDDGPINYPSLMVRGGIGGLLMGLANLVPGISGGTMLLASGVYPRFIRATSEVTRLKFRVPSLSVLAVVGGAAGAAILLLAGAVKGLVVDHRWMMFSLFIGLTLGGVPVVWKMLRPATTAVWIGAVIGFTAMAALALVQAGEPSGGTAGGGWTLMVIAGMAGAGAMILPGVSGGYLLLVLGVYLPILGAGARPTCFRGWHCHCSQRSGSGPSGAAGSRSREHTASATARHPCGPSLCSTPASAPPRCS